MSKYSSKEIIKILKEHGFVLVRVKGSHHMYKNKAEKRAVVPHPRKDLPRGTFFAILRQAGIKEKN